MNYHSSAKRLKIARKAAGFSSAKSFAESFKIPQSTYALHETGQRNLTLAAATKYAKLLGINVQWLLFGRGEASENSSKSNLKEFLTEAEHKLYLNKDSLQTNAIGTKETSVDTQLLKQLITTLLTADNIQTLGLNLEEVVETSIDIYAAILASTTSDEEKEKLLDLSLAFLKPSQKMKKVVNQ